jgi:hypothetical protein
MPKIDLDSATRQEEEYLRKVHPTAEDIPGCMALFDDFLACNSAISFSHAPVTDHLTMLVLGFQLKSLYRHGHMSVCGPKMEEFKYCMSIKSLHPEEKRDAWIRRRAEWWARRRLLRSSEDVWDMRT